MRIDSNSADTSSDLGHSESPKLAMVDGEVYVRLADLTNDAAITRAARGVHEISDDVQPFPGDEPDVSRYGARQQRQILRSHRQQVERYRAPARAALVAALNLDTAGQQNPLGGER